MRRPTPRALGRERIRSLNQSAVISAIHRHGRISRTDLAAELRLSPAAITALTAPFLEEGLVVEAEVGTSPSVGRKPILLGINYDHAHVFGVKVMNHAVVAALTNLNAEVVALHEQALPDTRERTVVESVVAATAALRKLAEGAAVRPLGLGVSVPGVVDHLAGTIRHSQLFGWEQVPLAELLGAELGLPVLVENDVNALAVAERLYGIGQSYSSYLVVTIGRGIGCGIVVDGAVYRGAGGGAGEIGHIPVTSDGPVCGCGGTGCLEAYIGEAGLLRTARERGVIGPDDPPSALRAAADAGEAGAAQVYAEAGDRLGQALAGVVHTVDPEIVVLLGEGIGAWRHWEVGFEPAFRRHLMPTRRGLRYVVEPWDDDKWALGAAALVLASPFDAAGASGDQGRLVRQRLHGDRPAS